MTIAASGFQKGSFLVLSGFSQGEKHLAIVAIYKAMKSIPI